MTRHWSPPHPPAHIGPSVASWCEAAGEKPYRSLRSAESGALAMTPVYDWPAPVGCDTCGGWHVINQPEEKS